MTKIYLACTRKDIIMERSLNEQWSVRYEGERDEFLGDGGTSEFSNYLCEVCYQPFDTWEEALAHLTKEVA